MSIVRRKLTSNENLSSLCYTIYHEPVDQGLCLGKHKNTAAMPHKSPFDDLLENLVAMGRSVSGQL